MMFGIRMMSDMALCRAYDRAKNAGAVATQQAVVREMARRTPQRVNTDPTLLATLAYMEKHQGRDAAVIGAIA